MSKIRTPVSAAAGRYAFECSAKRFSASSAKACEKTSQASYIVPFNSHARNIASHVFAAAMGALHNNKRWLACHV
ncbi:hypothetical protein APS_2642 [Acetobacter pasteurianus subsp. pasteurianus LMG 1262 = NBRC 106471]|nr:hypothetical protein APS_2642 [Acetobacter pasteurianus subsp. pasteurianus LMG 1262 = NBRC 106471]